jgi:phage terminase Nu1 subunit (DNA packaging protein)
MTQVEYAKHIGVSQPRIAQLKKTGALKKAFKKIGGRQLIDIQKADKLMKENLNIVAQDAYRRTKDKKAKPIKKQTVKQEKIQAADFSKLTINEAQQEQARYKAALLKLKYEQKSKLLVSAEQVEKDFFTIARTTRDAILSVPDRLAAELASSDDVHFVLHRLTEEITKSLEELSK